MGWGGVWWGGVGCGGSCTRVGHVGGWVMQGWGGSCRGGMGYVEVGGMGHAGVV